VFDGHKVVPAGPPFILVSVQKSSAAV